MGNNFFVSFVSDGGGGGEELWMDIVEEVQDSQSSSHLDQRMK